MSLSATDLVRRTSKRLKETHGVDTGLAKVARAMDKEQAPSRAIQVGKRRLRERLNALKAAAHELEQLGPAIAYIEEILPLTAEGWPARKAELDDKLRGDPDQGLAEWLGDWFSAASYCRIDALERLHAIERLPPRQRTVITLRDVEGWTADEVRNALELSETNQRVLLHRARAKVRQALEQYLSEEQ